MLRRGIIKDYIEELREEEARLLPSKETDTETWQKVKQRAQMASNKLTHFVWISHLANPR